MLSRKQKTVTAESSQRTHHCLQGTRGTRRNPRTWNHIRNPNAPARRKRVERRSEARSKDACNLEVALNFFFAQKEIRSYQQAELQLMSPGQKPVNTHQSAKRCLSRSPKLKAKNLVKTSSGKNLKTCKQKIANRRCREDSHHSIDMLTHLFHLKPGGSP